MNAWELHQNQTAIISLLKDSAPTILKRLEDLGFSVGETIQCLKHTPFNGPRVYQNSHGIFSLEEDVATLIEVQEL